MKKIVIINVVLVSIIFSQSINDFSPDQKKIYNREKLTVEKIIDGSSNVGWYWWIYAGRVDTWRAFEGLSNPIEPEQFFKITGYDKEASIVSTNKQKSQSKIINGYLLYLIGLYASLKPVTETDKVYDVYNIETVTYPFLIPGTIAQFAGLYFVYDGFLKKLKPVAPYQTAYEIAEDYNNQLIIEILKSK